MKGEALQSARLPASTQGAVAIIIEILLLELTSAFPADFELFKGSIWVWDISVSPTEPNTEKEPAHAC